MLELSTEYNNLDELKSEVKRNLGKGKVILSQHENIVNLFDDHNLDQFSFIIDNHGKLKQFHQNSPY